MDKREVLMAYDFNHKNIWITGASSGIGLGLAKKLASCGANIIVTSRNKEKLETLFAEHKNIHILAGDLTNSSANEFIAQQMNEKLGSIDCVILNAGSAEYIDIKNFSADIFERMIQVNFLSMVKGIAASLPYLRQSKSPYLVGMSSSAAWHGLPQGQAYSASKAAIRNLFQGLRIELSAENIDVSWICPGFVETPLTDKNNFPMPAKVTVEQASNIIYKKLSKQTAEIHFPKRFTYLLKLISILPASWASRILKGTIPDKKNIPDEKSSWRKSND